jgi:hypothetical protein
MKVLFFTNTPAHVHLYRHAVDRLADRGHDVLVAARDYGCTLDLLDYHDVPYETYGGVDTSKLSLLRELPGHYAAAFRIGRRFDPDLVFGMGGYAAHTAAVTRTPAVLVVDSEPTTLDHLVSRPFARLILTPHAFEKDLGPKHVRFRGFKETAYLHPDVFEPTTDVRDHLGVGADEPYAVVRLNAFGSHHDVGEGGFTPAQRRELIDRLSAEATVFVSDEGDDLDTAEVDARPFSLHPARFHDALAGANLVVADTQTVVTEAALLGTPAIRSNSFVGEDDMGNFKELAAQDLVRNVESFDRVRELAPDLVTEAANERWQRRREEYLSGLVNLTDLITSVAENRGTVETPGGDAAVLTPGRTA